MNALGDLLTKGSVLVERNEAIAQFPQTEDCSSVDKRHDAFGSCTSYFLQLFEHDYDVEGGENKRKESNLDWCWSSLQ